MKKIFRSISYHPFMIRLLHWEYWPFHIVYAAIYPVFIWYCIKARSFFFYSAANPSIENGGFLMESKKKIHDLIPIAYQPLTLFFEQGTGIEQIINSIQHHKLCYPVIVKPDIGSKGLGVMKAHTETELKHAVNKLPCAFIVQPFVAYENEIGLFYVRYPNQAKGTITGIVKKEFMKITGNGESTVEELIRQNKRYVLQIKALQTLCADKMAIVLPKGEDMVLLPFGNHARGSLFVDASEWIDEAFIDSMNKVCSEINGFYYGRMDIKYADIGLLKQGKDFSIIELNGAGSEPTHIYDPKHSIFFAWKEIVRHWGMLYKIAVINKKQGNRFMSFRAGREMFGANFRYSKHLDLL